MMFCDVHRFIGLLLPVCLTLVPEPIKTREMLFRIGQHSHKLIYLLCHGYLQVMAHTYLFREGDRAHRCICILFFGQQSSVAHEENCLGLHIGIILTKIQKKKKKK